MSINYAIHTTQGTAAALNDIAHERELQDAKWGVQHNTPDRWLTILMEEVGEMAKENLERDRTRYREELVQVAAVACAMLECFDRDGQTL